MIDLTKIAKEAAGVLLNWGKTTAHPDWRAPNEQQIELVLSYMQEAQAQGHIEGLEMAATAVRDRCEACGGSGGTVHEGWDVIAVADEHGEPQPMQVPIQIPEPCEYCGRPIAAIHEFQKELEAEKDGKSMALAG